MTDQTPTATDEDDPTLGPDGTEAVDLDPTGCPYTWTPGADTPLGKLFDRVRCTRPIHDGDDHHWDSREQEERTERVRARLIEAMDANPAGLTPGTAYRVRVNGGDAATMRTLDADA